MTYDATSIRLDVIARLKAKSLAGGNVWDSRTFKVTPERCPMLDVYSAGASDDPRVRQAPIFQHTERIAIDGYLALKPEDCPDTGDDASAKADAQLARDLDVLERQVKASLFRDPVWFGLWEAVTVEASSKSTGVNGAMRLGEFHLVLGLQYNDPWTVDHTATRTPFEGVDLHEDINRDGSAELEQHIEVPQ